MCGRVERKPLRERAAGESPTNGNGKCVPVSRGVNRPRVAPLPAKTRKPSGLKEKWNHASLFAVFSSGSSRGKAAFYLARSSRRLPRADRSDGILLTNK